MAELELELINFKCDDDLSQYITSMLFDSDTCIAEGVFTHGDIEYNISLMVKGDVSVEFNDEVYNEPSDYPDELVNIFKEFRDNYYYDDRLYVNLNNWFEYIVVDNKEHSDGVLFEDDLFKMTSKDIRLDMEMVLKECIIPVWEK